MKDKKLSIRPVINNIRINEDISKGEKFQNATLRPIIKLQHELLVAFFENYLNRKKIDLSVLGSQQKEELVAQIFNKDTLFKAEVRGLIIGLFTADEFSIYLDIASDTNKRILTIVKERLLSVF